MPRRSNDLRVDDLRALCGSTVVLTRQLEELGVPRTTTRHRCRPGGPWRSLLPGVVKLSNSAPDRNDHRAAALLYAGPDAVITGLDALELHGMRRMPSPSGLIHVLVPADRRRIGAGRVLVERTERLPAPAPGRWPVAPATRAALDFSRRSKDRDVVRATLAEVVQRGSCTPAELHRELRLGSARGSALAREVLSEIGDGVRSVAEAKARELVLGTELPPPMWNPRLLDDAGRFIARPDAWFDDVALAWEIDSREWHLSPEDYERTLERRSAMMARGVVVMHTQPSKLIHRPGDVRAELRSNYVQAQQRRRPAVHALPPHPAA
jgi:hypothetical protein